MNQLGSAKPYRKESNQQQKNGQGANKALKSWHRDPAENRNRTKRPLAHAGATKKIATPP